MIKQIINVNNYWKVIVYYNVNYNLFHYISKDLHKLHISSPVEKNAYNMLYTKQAKAATISNIKYKTSIILFNKHKSTIDYINSIVHEAEHVKDAILSFYGGGNDPEIPAYTIGYLVSEMYKVFIDDVVCDVIL